jgi:hypothetical protein
MKRTNLGAIAATDRRVKRRAKRKPEIEGWQGHPGPGRTIGFTGKMPVPRARAIGSRARCPCHVLAGR